MTFAVEMYAYHDEDAQHLARIIENRLVGLLPPTATVTTDSPASDEEQR